MEKLLLKDLSDYTTEARGIKNNIILHWSASTYGATFDDYHINITGDGGIWIDGSLSDRRSHTWHRNTQAIGISLSCMLDGMVTADGKVYYGNYPPTEAQLDTMAQVIAKICIEVGIPIANVWTHAEIADFDGYGIASGDSDCRWDLINQGDEIRNRARVYVNKWLYGY